jgi:hypothetical protein
MPHSNPAPGKFPVHKLPAEAAGHVLDRLPDAVKPPAEPVTFTVAGVQESVREGEVAEFLITLSRASDTDLSIAFTINNRYSYVETIPAGSEKFLLAFRPGNSRMAFTGRPRRAESSSFSRPANLLR